MLIPPGGRAELAVICRGFTGPVQLVTTTTDLPGPIGGLFPPNHVVLGLDITLDAQDITRDSRERARWPLLALPGRPLFLRELRSSEPVATFGVVFGDAAGRNVVSVSLSRSLALTHAPAHTHTHTHTHTLTRR